MIVPIIAVLVVVLLSMIVTRVATIALTLTGMSSEIARFQARSALTGAGFTTSESESVVGHPVRRRIVATLMLIGSAGIVSVIGGVALTFAQSGSNRAAAGGALALAGGVAFLLWALRLRPVDRALSRIIRRMLRRYTDLHVRDYEALLQIHGDYTIAELQVDADDWIADRTLAEMRLNDEGVLILGVQRHGGTYDGAPTGTTTVHVGDVLVLYGHQDRIEDLDVRQKGPQGDVDHDLSTAEFAATRVPDTSEQHPDDTPDHS